MASPASLLSKVASTVAAEIAGVTRPSKRVRKNDTVTTANGKANAGSEAKKIYWADSPEYKEQLVPSRLSPGAIDPHDDRTAPIVIRRYALGKEGDVTTAIPRENVLDFFYPHSLEIDGQRKGESDLSRLKMRRDLFLLAFAKVQSLPSSDKWSFYQIAGIHGIPYVPYDGATGSWDPTSSNWYGGYCQHGSPLFPTWHRPYCMLLEQSIIRQAKLVGESLSDTAEQKAVASLAEQLRFPFWDSANHTSRILGLPDVFTLTEISLSYPWKSITRRSIPNPLKSFVLPENLGTPFANSDVYNPTSKPHYEVPNDFTPFTPLGYPTVRHVTSAYTTKNDLLNLTLLRNAETQLVPAVHAVFKHNDWLSFSNHNWSAKSKSDKQSREYGHYSSVELAHDLVHTTVGGSGGQMSYSEIAGFDPIFFFHHANVDRLTALWQYCYPTVWIPSDNEQPAVDGTFTEKPGNAVDSSTELTPFRCSAEQFLNSDDVRTVDSDCGYSYPEIILARKKQWAPALMLHHVLHLYKPPQHFVHRWFLVVERLRKGSFSGPFSIRVFLDLPDADASTPISSPHYAGFVFVFTRSEGAQQDIAAGAGAGSTPRCANCEQRPFMRASLELTATMLRLGITTQHETGGEDVDSPPPSNPLEGAIKLVYVNAKGTALPEPSTQPQLKIVYEKGVRDEDIYDALLDASDNSANASSTSDVARQCHDITFASNATVFPLTI